jgi:acyl-CoA synthetase (AMP-forming)/AMP-acid ligase II
MTAIGNDPGAIDPLSTGEAFTRVAERRADASFDATDLEAFARERLASYKLPRIWRQVEQFPLTASGKVHRFGLAERRADRSKPTIVSVSPHDVCPSICHAPHRSRERPSSR